MEWLIGALVVVGLLLALRTAAGRRAGSQARGHVGSARRASRTEAGRGHPRAVRVAEKRLRRQERRHAQAVASAEKRLARADDVRGSLLTRYHGCTLYGYFIETPHGSGSVVRASAAAGSAPGLATRSRELLTRLAARGCAPDPLVAVLSARPEDEAVNGYALYLLIDSPSVSCVVTCPPAERYRATVFATRVTTAGMKTAERERSRHQLVAQARGQLRTARADRRAVDEARAEWEQAQHHVTAEPTGAARPRLAGRGHRPEEVEREG